MRIITQPYFVAAGRPYYILANAGVEYLDITDGKRYRQRTIPYGQNWVEILKEQIFIPSGGTVTSVGLGLPSVVNPAFSVSNSPVTSSGTIQLSFLGTSSQIILGDGTLAPVPTGAGNVTGRAGDIDVVTIGLNKEVQNAVLPFLLMGC